MQLSKWTMPVLRIGKSLDPGRRLGIGPGGTHIFLSSIATLAVAIVLVLNTGITRPSASNSRGDARPGIAAAADDDPTSTRTL